MKFPPLKNRIFVFFVCLAAATLTVSAQISNSRTSLKSLAPEAIGVDIEQCANGPLAAPVPCNTSGGNTGYNRGNVNEQKSHYYEGDSVPIRLIATGLTPGQYTVTLGYDYTKGGKYATDYLTDYDRTESVNNDPCVDVIGCTLASETNFTIPLDPEVAAGYNQIPGDGDDIIQVGGSFSCFGCTITNVTGYARTGVQTGDSSKTFTITFTASQANIVIAYGSHISTRSNWGMANSAINISGSPYHNYVVDFPGANSGSRDLQLSASAVIFPADVTIIKAVATLGAPPGTTATFQFDFTASANFGGNFSLVDNIVGDGGGGTASKSVGNITLFGLTNAISVTEGFYGPTWTLSGITCVSNPNGGSGTDNNTINLPGRNVSIVLEEGESVTCTFKNTQLQPTAAPVELSGRVSNSLGYGLSYARVYVQNASTGEVRSALTNNFGYYRVTGLEAGEFYQVNVSHKGYTFQTQFLSMADNVSGFDFTANPE